MSELDEPTERMSKTTTNEPEQLRECVNSGQVSAAQVVAHAGADELSMSMRRQLIRLLLA